MNPAAEVLGTTQGFLRSAGGHRRYSRCHLRIAARVRELVDHGTPIEAACRIVILEDQLEEAMCIHTEHRRARRPVGEPAGLSDVRPRRVLRQLARAERLCSRSRKSRT
jgi:DNA-binding transcriptional MerR regulator